MKSHLIIFVLLYNFYSLKAQDVVSSTTDISTAIVFQEKINVYFFAGHGSDSRIFEKLILDSNYYRIFIKMPEPDKKATINSYANSLISQIDTTKEFIFPLRI